MRFTLFRWILPDFTGFYRVSLLLTKFNWLLLCYTGFEFLSVLLGFIGFPPALSILTIVILDFTGFFGHYLWVRRPRRAWWPRILARWGVGPSIKSTRLTGQSVPSKSTVESVNGRPPDHRGNITIVNNHTSEDSNQFTSGGNDGHLGGLPLTEGKALRFLSDHVIPSKRDPYYLGFMASISLYSTLQWVGLGHPGKERQYGRNHSCASKVRGGGKGGFRPFIMSGNMADDIFMEDYDAPRRRRQRRWMAAVWRDRGPPLAPAPTPWRAANGRQCHQSIIITLQRLVTTPPFPTGIHWISSCRP